MSVLNRIKAVLRDPPPEFAFEISADGIAMSRTRPPATVQFAPLRAGVVSPSPVKDNILDQSALAAAVQKLVPTDFRRMKRPAALILPDNALRVAVLDFERLPEKEEERRSLIRFRMRKTLPFDVDEAAFSYYAQTGARVIAVVAPVDLIARYEAPFRAAGLHPGMVTSSSLALLELLPEEGSVLVAHRSTGALTVLHVREGELALSRTLELSAHRSDPLEEISEDLYPTLVYVEDQTGARPDRLILVGFGDASEEAAARLGVELDIATEALHVEHPGLTGYLRTLSISPRKAAA